MADGIRKIASALYERAGQEGKREAIDYFDALDSNKDRKVSLGEFQNGYDGIVESQLSNDGVFKELSSNADGTLSFEDVLVIFYSKKGMIEILPCDECEELIFGPSFSSFSQNSRHTICCRCYSRGVSIHPRPSRSTPTPAPANNLTLVNYTDPTLSTRKEEKKVLQEIARLHYTAASPKMQRYADEFFDSMDGDRDERVSVRDFKSFMVQKGYRQFLNPQLFEDLDDVRRTGTLRFWDVMTLYYIIKSGRPNCDLCKNFIPGVFFTCVRCFKKGLSFNLCPKCYKEVDCNFHLHNGGTQFLDNYTLLQTLRESSPLPRHPSDSPSSSTAICPSSFSRVSNMEVAYKGLELAIAICNTASNIVLTAGSIAELKCTIM